MRRFFVSRDVGLSECFFEYFQERNDYGMETAYYLNKFQKIADDLDPKHFSEKKLESKVGIWLHSVALKVQKRSWINASPDDYGGLKREEYINLIKNGK